MNNKDLEYILSIEERIKSSITNSSNLKLYTEEDMKKAIEMAREKHDYLYGYSWNKEQIIQSLSQPKMVIAFECEIVDGFTKNNDEYVDELGAKGNYYTHSKIIKTTTNSQGQTQWVGRYIYA